MKNEDKNIEKWNVNTFDFPKTIYLKALYDDSKGLRLIVKKEKEDEYYLIHFDQYICYRNSDESERIKFFNSNRTIREPWSLFILNTSDFIDWIVEESLEIHIQRNELTHYLIITPDDIVDIISTTTPLISRIDKSFKPL